MYHVQKLSSFDAPELLPYRTMKHQVDHHAQRIFVAEGEKIVRRLLESALTVVSVLMPAKWLSDYEPLLGNRAENISVFVAEKEVLEQLTGFSMYQGLLAVGKVPQPIELAAVLHSTPQPRFFIAADGISNAENIGVLVRNAVAFGAQALVVGETSTHPYLRRAVRSSMGTIFKLPVIESNSLPQTLGRLREQRISCVAAHAHTNRRNLSQAKLTGDCCLVFGAEGDGISSETLAVCDEWVAVPMQNGVDSLNVGSASAVFLHEVARQRQMV